MKNNRIRLMESQLHNIIRRCINEEIGGYTHSIKWDKLLDSIKSQINSKVAAWNFPGEYSKYRMHAFLHSEEPKYSIRDEKMADEIRKVISSFDVRNVKELVEFCEKMGLTYPKWLKGNVTPELTEDGWVIFGK